MRVIRIEHMSVLRNDRPAGPYGEEAFVVVEHEDEDYWNMDCDYDECIHMFADRISWKSGGCTPMPHTDGLHHFTRDYLFAFQSVEQMRRWFSGELRNLDRFGFVAAVYEVSDVQHGGRQSVFHWDTAVRITDAPVPKAATLNSLLSYS